MKIIYLLMLVSAVMFGGCQKKCCMCIDGSGVSKGTKCYKTKSEKSEVETLNGCTIDARCD